MSATFDSAVRLARKALARDRRDLPVDERIGYTIVSAGVHHGVGAFRVYQDTAWDRPAGKRAATWQPPFGDPVAHVSVDGAVAPLRVPTAAA